MAKSGSNGRGGGGGRVKRQAKRLKKGKSGRAGKSTSKKLNGKGKLTIPSSFLAARAVQTQIMDAVKREKFDSHSMFAINLAVEEALINAIKHGNKLNKNKKVKIEFKVNPKRAEIIIEDQGKGFNRQSVPDPTLDENLCKTCGRGLLLIEAYMTKVKFSLGGRRVRMIKENQAE